LYALQCAFLYVVCFFGIMAKLWVCHVLFPWHTANQWLWRVLFLTHSILYTYKIRYFILTKNLSTSKLFLLSMYNIWYLILKFGMFLYLFVIFN
jgi:hypothetical protein